MKFTTALSLGLAFILSHSANAQESLDTTTISSSRLQTKYKETGKTVQIISAKDIENYPVNSIEDLLVDLAGVNLNARSGFGVQTDIGLRGSTFSQVLVLIDNQRLNDGLTSHFNNNIPIALSEIQQIEVIKGPSGVGYGNDAVGGVIHIKTKTYMAQPDLGFNFYGKSSLGQYGLKNHDLGVFLNTKKWAFSAATKQLKADGQELANPNFGLNPNGDSLYNKRFDVKNYTVAGTFFKNAWKIYVRGAMDVRDFDAKYFYTASTYDESVEMVKAYWLQSAVIYKTEKQLTEFNIGYKNNTDSFDFNPLFTVNGHLTQRLNATITQNRNWKSTKFAYGIQYDQNSIESSDRGNHDNFSIAAFAQSRLSFKDKILVVLGARVENDDYYGLNFVPQVTGTYITKSVIYRTSVGQSLRNPDYTERFVNFNTATVAPNRNIGNPDVKPEKSFSADFNADWKVTSKFRLSQSIFYRTSNNLIDYFVTNSNTISNITNLMADTTYYYTRNLSNSNTLGYEMSGKYTLLETDTSYVKFAVDYTYMLTNNKEGEVSKYIANHPIQIISPRVTVRYNRFRASLSGNYLTRNPEEIPSILGEVKNQYFLVNAKLSYKPPLVPARVFVECRNLLNTEYQEILGAQMPGRWIYGGLMWRWGEKKSK